MQWASFTWCTWLALGAAAVGNAHAQDTPSAAEAPASDTPNDAPPTPALAPEATADTPPTPSEAPATEAHAPTAAEAPPAPADAAPAPLDWTRYVKIGGGGILWYNQPLYEGGKNRIDFFHIRLEADFTAGDFAFHIEPRFRDSKLRTFYDGPVWIQEGYGSYAPNEHIKIKVGKAYSRLGLFWDNSFYGNVQVYDGLKLAADYGISAEGTFGDRAGLNVWAQYFLIDGQTNVSLPGRDTFSIPGARRRNEGVLNLEPFFRFGDAGLLKVGVSGQVLRADIPNAADTVLRAALHAKLTWAGLGVWGEYLHQAGKHVSEYPIAGVPATDDTDARPGRESGKNDYLLFGAEYTWKWLTLRYNTSAGFYHDVDVREWF
ncbi:MAG: hypothetical protein ABW321_28685, partial [Polyangiales bacterium]